MLCNMATQSFDFQMAKQVMDVKDFFEILAFLFIWSSSLFILFLFLTLSIIEINNK